MSENNSLQPLVKVSTEVEESQTKLDLVNFCIKAQQDLAHKLRKEAQRRKENCNFVKNNNLQLESEIRHAENEIQSLRKSYETIKSANVELKKELLLSQNFNSELIEQMKEGEKKYENLWVDCKSRYEGIPYIQKWLTASKNVEDLKKNVSTLENEAKLLQLDIKTKIKTVQDLDRKKLLSFVEFIVYEMPEKRKLITQKTVELKEIQKEIEKISKRSEKKVPIIQFEVKETAKNTMNTAKSEDGWPTLRKDNNDDDGLQMPKLRLASAEVDVLSVKLELKKVVHVDTAPIRRTSSITDCSRNVKPKAEEKQNTDYSSYFNKPSIITDKENSSDASENFSDRKLINILEDITLDNQEAFNIVSNVNPVQLMEVDTIGDVTVRNKSKETGKNKVVAPMESDEIEEIDLTAKSEFQDILMPPTQFVDLTQIQGNTIRSCQQEVEVIIHMDMEGTRKTQGDHLSPTLKNSQETKKKVTFDIPMTIPEEDNETEKLNNSECTIVNTTSETVTSQLDADVPAVTEDSYMSIKDMILQKHNLDLSPQFVYAKNNVFQKKIEEGTTSKFFADTHQSAANELKPTLANTNTKDVEVCDEKTKEETDNIKIGVIQKPIADAVVEETVTSPRAANKREAVAGMLFTHGPQGIPESLDVSMSTTGFDDAEGEYAHCLDNSLLLSPKAVDISMSGNNENGMQQDSQELPNFLTGFRKTGLSFFGQQSRENIPETSGSSQENNFNFNFGSQEKKARGGLFSFFH